MFRPDQQITGPKQQIEESRGPVWELVYEKVVEIVCLGLGHYLHEAIVGNHPPSAEESSLNAGRSRTAKGTESVLFALYPEIEKREDDGKPLSQRVKHAVVNPR